MQRVCSRGGDDRDLRAVALAVAGAVGVGDDVEFAHRVDAEQLAAGAAGRDVDERGSGVLDSVEEEEIVLRAAAADGKHVAHRGVGGSGAARTLAGIVHGGGIEGQQLVEAAAVERELLDLALVDETGGLLRSGVHDRVAGLDYNRFADRAHAQSEVHLHALPDDQHDAGLSLRLKAVVRRRDRVVADGNAGRCVAAVGAGDERAREAGVGLADGDGSAADCGPVGVVNGAANVAANNLGDCRR